MSAQPLERFQTSLWVLLAALDLVQLFAQLLVLLLGFLQPASQVSNLLLRFRLDVIGDDDSRLQIGLELTPFHRFLLHVHTDTLANLFTHQTDRETNI